VNVCADRTLPPTPGGPLDEAAFGDLLRRSREAQGIALEVVARRTRIAPHHLEALERSDLDALPAGPFGRSYIRAYAGALGIDAEPIVAAYRVQERRRGLGTPEGERRMLEELSLLAGRSAHASEPTTNVHRRAAWLVAAAAIAILATLGWFLASRRPRGTALVSTPVPPAPVASPEVVAPPRPPRAEPAPAPQSPSVSPPTESLRVSGFGVGTGVSDHRLVGRADGFTEGTLVVFWTEILGGRPGHVIRHVWYQGGRAVMRANLPIRAPHWRTQSSLVLPRGSAGGWTVEARTSDGRLLARNDFACEPLGAARPRSPAE